MLDTYQEINNILRERDLFTSGVYIEAQQDKQ